MEKLKRIIGRRKRLVIGIAAVLAVLLIVVLVKSALNSSGKETSEGVAYLKNLESQDMDKVEKEVKKVKRKAQEKAIEEGTLSVWAQFQDYVIYGDSRTVGFYYHEFLDKQRVLAEAGLTIKSIPDYMDQMVNLNPAHLFLCTGLNDVSIGYWPTPEEYVKAYEEVIKELQKKMPDTTIYINSIFPAIDPAFNKESDWKKIPDYNEALKAWCEEKGYTYIDNTEVFEEHVDLYDPDGVHFRKEMYEYWALNMLSEVEM